MERTCRIKHVDFGSMRALVSVQFGDFEIRGFKVIDQGNGRPWVAPPSREITREGKKEYYDIVRILDEKTKKEFNDWVLEAYFADSDESATASTGGRNGGNGRKRG